MIHLANDKGYAALLHQILFVRHAFIHNCILSTKKKRIKIDILNK